MAVVVFQMALAEILDSNPQEFIMEAYSDPLKYYPPGLMLFIFALSGNRGLSYNPACGLH